MAMELSKVDQFLIKLIDRGAATGPGKLAVTQLVAALHRIPIIGDLLSPIIGQAKIVDFDVSPNTLAAQRPTAFTCKMPSFDGTLISVNYFPATNVAKGDVKAMPHGAGRIGSGLRRQHRPDHPLRTVVPVQPVRQPDAGHRAAACDDYFKAPPHSVGSSNNGGGGYNVITWDPRGEFASGGQLQIDNPFYEGRDVSRDHLLADQCHQPGSQPGEGHRRGTPGSA